MGAIVHWTDKRGASRSIAFSVVITETFEGKATITEHPVEKGANISDHVRDELDLLTLEVFVSNTPIGSYEDPTESLNTQKIQVHRDGRVTPTLLEVPVYEAPIVGKLGPIPIVNPGAALSRATGAIGGLLGPKENRTAELITFPTERDYVRAVLDTLRSIKRDASLCEVFSSKWEYEDMILTSISMPRDAESGTGASFTIEFRQIRTVEVAIVAAPLPTELRAKPKVSKGAQGPKAAAAPQKKTLALLALEAAGVAPPR